MLVKAAALPADEVVVDLEDGVAVEQKEAARANLASARALGTLAVRINGLATPWWRDDLAAALAANAAVLVLPKVDSPGDVAKVAALLPPGVGLEVQIETARGLVEVERIAAAGGPLEAVVFGPGDFAASLGVPVLTIGAGASEYALARIAVAARAHGLQAVDGPHAALDDEGALRSSAERALALAGDEQRPVRRDDLDGLRLHSGQLHDDVKRRRVLGAEAVALRPEAVPQAGESRHLPEVGEELLDLPLKVVDRSLAAGHVFTPTR